MQKWKWYEWIHSEFNSILKWYDIQMSEELHNGRRYLSNWYWCSGLNPFSSWPTFVSLFDCLYSKPIRDRGISSNICPALGLVKNPKGIDLLSTIIHNTGHGQNGTDSTFYTTIWLQVTFCGLNLKCWIIAVTFQTANMIYSWLTLQSVAKCKTKTRPI